MPKQVTYFYCPTCPAAESCSKPAWDRAKCSGKSREAAMLAVVDHLVLSGKHNLIRPEAIVMADSHAEILFWCTEEPSDDEVVAVRSSKKSRGSAGGIDRLQEIADEAPAKFARVMELMHNSSKAIRTAEATCSQAAKALRDEANMLDKAHAELQQMHRK